MLISVCHPSVSFLCSCLCLSISHLLYTFHLVPVCVWQYVCIYANTHLFCVHISYYTYINLYPFFFYLKLYSNTHSNIHNSNYIFFSVCSYLYNWTWVQWFRDFKIVNIEVSYILRICVYCMFKCVFLDQRSDRPSINILHWLTQLKNYCPFIDLTRNYC